MAYAIDPELLPWLEMLPSGDFTDPVEAREQFRRVVAGRAAYETSTPVSIEEKLIPGPDGAPDVRIRVYTPTGRPAPRPGYLSIHGGGFVIGDLDMDEAGSLAVADEIGAVVVSVDYRLAPEHPYPAGIEDCYAALAWTAANAADLGIDPDRLAIGGGSAGGGLSAGLALLARDRGGPAICFQYLGIPELDDRLDTPSMTQFVDTPMWNRPRAVISWDAYLGGRPADQYASPARAEDLSGLPPAYVSVCEFDPLRDEGLIYAHRLIQAGVPTEVHHYPGTFHGSGLVESATVSRRMAAEMLDALRRGLKA
ncbi:alpha/beta hydrolase [Kutzneria sp. 744]|uniref:alpha/beta hydrolase n=1 Tax=Kutzneria sp. (strain 744) TaxID=345341 RepID=UPI0005C2416C|nr:alpha/beta hydrolase [Kutzneria sp. 744]